jgi:hypothetical protein
MAALGGLAYIAVVSLVCGDPEEDGFKIVPNPRRRYFVKR